MNFSQLTQRGALILSVLQIAIFISGCEIRTEFTNEPPKIINFTVPAEVEYGETVEFRIIVYDAEDDPLTYSWEVSAGTLTNAAEPEVQWTAPELPPGEVVPSKEVRVHASVHDGHEETSKKASITVFSKTYKVMREGTDAVDVDPEPINTDEAPIEITDVDPEPINTDEAPIEITDVDPEPINTDEAPIEITDVDPEPINTDEAPIEITDVDPEPINTDGTPVEITDETFVTTVLNAKLPIVFEFRADWSPFCKQMRPIVDAVAVGSRDTFITARLDIDKNPLTPRAYKVDDIPTYLVFRDGKEVARFTGPMPKPIFLQKILDALK